MSESIGTANAGQRRTIFTLGINYSVRFSFHKATGRPFSFSATPKRRWVGMESKVSRWEGTRWRRRTETTVGVWDFGCGAEAE